MPEKIQPENSWTEYSRLVLAQLDTNTGAIKEIGNAMHQLRNELGTQLSIIRVQTVQDLSGLEARVNTGSRTEVAQIREHFDSEIEAVQKVLDAKMASISVNFEKRVTELGNTMQAFVNNLTNKIDTLATSVSGLNVAVNGLQIKAGIWGAAGSILGVVAIWLVSQLPKLLGKI